MKYLNIKTVLALTLLALPACESIVHEPTHLSQNRMQVEEEAFFEEVAVADLDDTYIAALSKHYSRHGDGAVDLTVTYDPRSKTSTAMTASNEIARISEALRKNGVRDVEVNIMPVKGQGGDAKALVSYTAYNALAPDDCTLMPGLGDLNVDNDDDYKIGCSVDTVFARQIARPKDLKGRAQNDLTSDGRRSSNIVEAYRTGARNEPLDGERASGN